MHLETGVCRNYVEGMWLMMQHSQPDDWVLATGETHTVKEFLEIAFQHLDLDWSQYVKQSEKHLRPNEVNYLLGDSTKAKTELG